MVSVEDSVFSGTQAIFNDKGQTSAEKNDRPSLSLIIVLRFPNKQLHMGFYGSAILIMYKIQCSFMLRKLLALYIKIRSVTVHEYVHLHTSFISIVFLVNCYESAQRPSDMADAGTEPKSDLQTRVHNS